MNTHTPDDRRRALLVTVAVSEASSATLAHLTREMDLVHNMPVSRDLTHADLLWLHEMGLIRYGLELAQITERGRDVARRAAPWPGGR